MTMEFFPLVMVFYLVVVTFEISFTEDDTLLLILGLLGVSWVFWDIPITSDKMPLSLRRSLDIVRLRRGGRGVLFFVRRVWGIIRSH